MAIRMTRCWRWFTGDQRWHFDFASPERRFCRITPAGALLLILLALWLWHSWHGLRLAQQHAQQLQAQLASVQMPIRTPRVAKAAIKPVASAQDSQLQAEVRQASQQLNVQWFRLLSALERPQTAEVALLQVTPDLQHAQLILSGEAKHYHALLIYLARLQAEQDLHHVYLQKHQVNESHPQQPVSFEIHGEWRP